MSGHEGSWPENCVQRAFVTGARWWQFTGHHSTMFPSESDQAEAEAIKRYGEPPNDDLRKQDEVAQRLARRMAPPCDKPGHVTSSPDPAVNAFCVTCEAQAIAREFSQPNCGHVPARPDVDLTVCWKCGVEIIPDPDTRLWRPLTAAERLVKIETIRQCRDLFFALHQSEYTKVLWEKIETKLAPSIRLAESALGRWIIVNGLDESLAWSGSRWVSHHHGFPTGEAQVSNFATREEAAAYAVEQFPGKTPDPGA